MIAAPAGKFGHQDAVRISVGPELRFERGERRGMPFQRHAERGGRGLPRVVVRGRADAAEAEDDVAARECLPEHGCERVAIVALVARPVEPETLSRERGDDVREMTILALARKDLVTDDQRADAGCGPWPWRCGNGDPPAT